MENGERGGEEPLSDLLNFSAGVETHVSLNGDVGGYAPFCRTYDLPVDETHCKDTLISLRRTPFYIQGRKVDIKTLLVLFYYFYCCFCLSACELIASCLSCAD